MLEQLEEVTYWKNSECKHSEEGNLRGLNSHHNKSTRQQWCGNGTDGNKNSVNDEALDIII